MLSEKTPRNADAALYLDGNIHSCADSTTQVDKLGNFIIHYSLGEAGY